MVIYVRQAYSGKQGCEITEEEKKLVEKLRLLSKETMVEETIRVAKILKENRVNLSRIQLSLHTNDKKKFIKLGEIKQAGIDIEKIIEENDLDREFLYGKKVSMIREAYNGIGTYSITEEEKKTVEELGLITKESAIAEFLRIAQILKENGIKLKRIPLMQRINGEDKFIQLKEIKQEGIDIEKIIKENGLDGEFSYGSRISMLRRAYKGMGQCVITEKEKKLAEELGVLSKESIISKTLSVAQILKENGVDLRRIKLVQCSNGKENFIKLKDIKQKGIDIEKIIKENYLDREFPYGVNISIIRQAYQGKGKSIITKEEKRLAEELGVLSKETAIAETLRVAQILKENGVDLGKISLTQTSNGKANFIKLKDIEQTGIDIEKIIKENGLDGEFLYGSRIAILRLAYKGIGKSVITEEEKKLAEELGLIKLKITGQDIGQATFDVSTMECDKAQAALSKAISTKTKV